MCQIPYTDNNIEYYHCKNTANECKTTGGVFSKCADGKFHYAKPGSKFEPYTVEFLFPTITLPEPGEYLARFYILMLCNKEGCEDAQDYIALSVNDANNGNASVAYREYMLKDLEMEKKWIQQEVRFKSSTGKINVNLFESVEFYFESILNSLFLYLAFIPHGQKSAFLHIKFPSI